MEKEKAQECLREILKYKDSETGIYVVLTAEDYITHLNLAVINGDLMLNDTKIGEILFQIEADNNILNINQVRLNEDYNKKGFGTRGLEYATKVAKKYGADFVVITTGNEVVEKITSRVGWTNNLKEAEKQYDFGKKI